MDIIMISLILFLALFFLASIFLRVNVPFSLGIAGLGILLFAGKPVLSYAPASFNALDSLPFLAIPFFIFAGTIMEHSGISRLLLDWINSFVGRVKGSSGYVTTLACMAFGVLTGSAIATLTSIGKIMMPEMERRGYPKNYAAALAASTCFLGILIPPSVPGIMYAQVAGISTNKVWLSTVGPAFVIGVLYCVYNYFRAGRTELLGEKTQGSIAQRSKEIVVQTYYAIPALLMPVIIFGGIYGGIFTATEAGAVCVVYGIGYYVIRKFIFHKEVSSNLLKIFIASGVATASIGMINALAGSAGRALAFVGVSDRLAEFVTANISSPAYFLLICNILFLFMGTFMNINATILMLTPLLMPSINALGIDPVFFGGMMLVNLSIGFITPPYASGIFMSSKLSNASFTGVTKECLPFCAIGIITIIISCIFPEIITFIPNLF